MHEMKPRVEELNTLPDGPEAVTAARVSPVAVLLGPYPEHRPQQSHKAWCSAGVLPQINPRHKRSLA